MSEQAEGICVQRFLNWYNERYKRNYTYERAENHFHELKDGLRWEFVAYDRDNRGEWMGIEVKELVTVRETHIQFEFWRDLCLELTRDLERRGIQGEFGMLPPSFRLIHRDRPKFRQAFIEVLCQKAPNMKVDEITNIGPDIADKFTNWPKEQSRNLDEYNKWGKYRPSELQITKSTGSECEVKSLTSPMIVHSVPEAHEKTFNEVFSPRGVKANKQLKFAKEKGARETSLLLACDSSVDEGLIKNQVRNLDRQLISDIDCIYLVDMGNKDRIVKLYPD